jgi:hypothetical protein
MCSSGIRKTYPATFLLVKLAVLGELLVQLALRGKLEDEEDPLRVVEVAVETQDVWVSRIVSPSDLTAASEFRWR